MTTVTTFSFTPSDTATPPFSFAFNTEGGSFTGECTWNMAAQRWYLQIYDAAQSLVINHPLVSSLSSAPQNLALGVFERTTISYASDNELITITESDAPVAVSVGALDSLNLIVTTTISVDDVSVYPQKSQPATKQFTLDQSYLNQKDLVG